jgi:hypothetical protein
LAWRFSADRVTGIGVLSRLAAWPELRIREAEINPMQVMPECQGVMAVDALVLAG